DLEDQRTRRQADERQLRADLEPRFGHHLEDEGRLRLPIFPLARPPLPSDPRRHAKTARFPMEAGGPCFREPEWRTIGKNAGARPLAIPPRLAIFPLMMLPASIPHIVRAMAGKDDDVSGTPGVGIAT